MKAEPVRTLKDILVDKRKRITIITTISALVVFAAIGGGWYAWTVRELNVAQAECDSAAATVKTVKAEYAKLVDGDAKTASAITAEQVKDTKTVETLASELKASAPETVTCPVKDKKTVQTATGKLDTQADWYKTHKAALSKAVKNVNSSKLDKVIDTANLLLADSNGKVQDNATRNELAKAIGAKNAKAIAEATQKVNDSIAVKTKADEEAKAQAEAEADTAAQTQSSYTGGNTTGYSGSSNNGGGTSSAPQADTQSTQTNDNSGSGYTGPQWIPVPQDGYEYCVLSDGSMFRC